MAFYTLDQLLGFAQQAGFQGSSAQTIAGIAYAESSGNDQAINYSDPGGSYGLTQINGAAHGPTAANTLGNPLEAFQQAFQISNGGTNFTPWSTYNSGAYLPYASQLGLSGSSSSSPLGGILGGTSGGSGSGGLAGTTATGQTTQSQSPLSAIFASIGNLFQSAGLLILGAILVAIGAWFIVKPGSA